MYPDFNTIKQFNDWGISQDLDWYCEYGFITVDQYKQLTGHDYGKSEDTSNASNQSNQSNQQSSQSTQSTAQNNSDKSSGQQNTQSSSNGQSNQSSGQGQPFTNNQAK